MHSDDYMDGYAAGKAKAHAEIRAMEPQQHMQGCKCEPCKTILSILTKLSKVVGH